MRKRQRRGSEWNGEEFTEFRGVRAPLNPRSRPARCRACPRRRPWLAGEVAAAASATGWLLALWVILSPEELERGSTLGSSSTELGGHHGNGTAPPPLPWPRSGWPFRGSYRRRRWLLFFTFHTERRPSIPLSPPPFVLLFLFFSVPRILHAGPRPLDVLRSLEKALLLRLD
jgi:hypothetical protein